jgi:NAD(P)-dependent dehydrogenase (short-subunit alcohol dehydrogenase family)
MDAVAEAQLKGKVAVVTGASSGLGKAIGSRLASRGAAVVVADLPGRQEQASAVALEIQAEGG